MPDFDLKSVLILIGALGCGGSIPVLWFIIKGKYMDEYATKSGVDTKIKTALDLATASFQGNLALLENKLHNNKEVLTDRFDSLRAEVISDIKEIKANISNIYNLLMKGEKK
jgi:hypothetical protein